MRKTSFGLGLAGSILAFVIAGIMLIFAVGFTVVSSVEWSGTDSMMDDMEIAIDGEEFDFDMDDFDGRMSGRLGGDFGDMPGSILNFVGGWLWFAVAALIVGGVLGIIGTVITKRRRSVAAGVLLLIAAVLCAFSLYGTSASALLIPSGVLAFIKDKNEHIEIEE